MQTYIRAAKMCVRKRITGRQADRQSDQHDGYIADMNKIQYEKFLSLNKKYVMKIRMKFFLRLMILSSTNKKITAINTTLVPPYGFLMTKLSTKHYLTQHTWLFFPPEISSIHEENFYSASSV